MKYRSQGTAITYDDIFLNPEKLPNINNIDFDGTVTIMAHGHISPPCSKC